MSTIYTPTPTPLTTITLPQDVINDVVVGTVNPPFQNLADAVAWQDQMNSAWGKWVFEVGTYPAATPFAISSLWDGGTGFALFPTEVEVPLAGVYMVSVNVYVSTAETSDPANVGFTLEAGALGTIGWARNNRFSGAGAGVPLSLVTYVTITNPATQRISVVNDNGASTDADLSIALPYLLQQLTIRRIQ